ncbi:hypothetical protein BT96DRAFT_919275 [Gymnopus androsaceus JB14]|uniref:Uncharacterized protein n=1 Tax=Gymnopus androsaceus JB14 TaxID=1447944 RepID=A0A6A4HU37_9AGAR|nr:hypothetical protein BT96DRAFT_919275 [Gymnopus androsaceus JB14]
MAKGRTRIRVTSNFNPLERREWQSIDDRRCHEVCLVPLNCGWRSYPAVENYREYEMGIRHLKEESKVFARSCDDYERENPELFPPRHKLQARREEAGMESGRCQVDISDMERAQSDIKVRGEGSVNVRMSRTRTQNTTTIS